MGDAHVILSQQAPPPAKWMIRLSDVPFRVKIEKGDPSLHSVFPPNTTVCNSKSLISSADAIGFGSAKKINQTYRKPRNKNAINASANPLRNFPMVPAIVLMI